MFFWKKTVTIYDTKTSLQASLNQNYPNKKDKVLNPNIKTSERTFSFLPSEVKASVCVEASLSFSFFLFFMINLLFIIFSFVSYSNDLAILQQRGKEISAYAYITKDLWENNEDLIVLKKQRKISSLFSILPVPDHIITSKAVVKPWVGYHTAETKTREEEEILVYITEYGSVYHRSRSCTHLSLSIQITARDSVEKEKNENGEYYKPCMSCGKNQFTSAVFVTSYGNRFHTSMNCKALKRTVKSVPLSTAEGMGACKKCG